MLVRKANEQLKKASISRGSNDANQFAFLCECGTCTSMLSLTLAEYESVRAYPARFVITPNHENPEDETVVFENGRFGIVETITSELSRIALERNPRWQRGRW
jgi:hypothetical protein